MVMTRRTNDRVTTLMILVTPLNTNIMITGTKLFPKMRKARMKTLIKVTHLYHGSKVAT
jgi:hypothetical protein